MELNESRAASAMERFFYWAKNKFVCDINTLMLFCVMKRDKAKKILPKGKNIRIPEDSFKIIKKYCDAEGLIMGRFIANAAILKMSAISDDVVRKITGKISDEYNKRTNANRND